MSEEDLAAEPAGPTPLVAVGSLVALTRGAAGVRLIGRDGVEDVPACPARVHDPTGAGDVFAAAYIVRYSETGDVLTAAQFASAAAALAVEGRGVESIGDRAQIEARLAIRGGA